MAALAMFIPARHALRTEPLEALRGGWSRVSEDFHPFRDAIDAELAELRPAPVQSFRPAASSNP